MKRGIAVSGHDDRQLGNVGRGPGDLERRLSRAGVRAPEREVPALTGLAFVLAGLERGFVLLRVAWASGAARSRRDSACAATPLLSGHAVEVLAILASNAAARAVTRAATEPPPGVRPRAATSSRNSRSDLSSKAMRGL